jgi:hypothetical protein
MIIQATTTGGAMIEKARWEIPDGGYNLHSLQVGHSISVCLATNDKNLLSNIMKQSKVECSVDKAGNGKHSVVLTMVVNQIRHMIDASGGKQSFSTMCIAVPVNRYVEQVMLHLLDPGKCDKRFAQSVRGS